jgi:hypothetical protein
MGMPDVAPSMLAQAGERHLCVCDIRYLDYDPMALPRKSTPQIDQSRSHTVAILALVPPMIADPQE